MANVQPKNIPKTFEEDQRIKSIESIERKGEKEKSKTNEIINQKLEMGSNQITEKKDENSPTTSSYSEQNLKEDFP